MTKALDDTIKDRIRGAKQLQVLGLCGLVLGALVLTMTPPSLIGGLAAGGLLYAGGFARGRGGAVVDAMTGYASLLAAYRRAKLRKK